MSPSSTRVRRKRKQIFIYPSFASASDPLQQKLFRPLDGPTYLPSVDEGRLVSRFIVQLGARVTTTPRYEDLAAGD